MFDDLSVDGLFAVVIFMMVIACITIGIVKFIDL